MVPCCVIEPSASAFTGNKDYNIDAHTATDFMDSEWLRYMRQSLMAGHKISECGRCWKKENQNILSQRQILNRQMKFDSGWIQQFFSKHHDQSWMILSADWKVSNLCNLGCVMCHPVDSSKLYSQWHQHRENIIVKQGMQEHTWQSITEIFGHEKQMRVLDEILSQPHVQWLKILGGEPLMHEKLFVKLLQLPQHKQKKIGVHFVTNGTYDMLSIADRFCDFREVTFTVSLDGVESTQEWIRAGSDWNQIQTHIKKAQSRHPIYIHCVVQALNLANVSDLWNWCVQNNLPLDLDLVYKPVHLSVQVLSLMERKDILERNRSRLITTVIKSHEHGQTDFEDLARKISEAPYLPDQRNLFDDHVRLHTEINSFDTVPTIN